MEMTMKDRMLNESPARLLGLIALPAIIGMMVIGLYPLIDGIYAGHLIGEKAMAAMSAALPITLLNNGIATLIGVGSSSILSRAIGRGESKKIEQIMGNLICWIFVFSLVTTLVGFFFADRFFGLLGAPEELMVLGGRYLRILFLGSFFVNFAYSANMLMRGEGEMKKAMLFMVFGAFVNIILDPIFMIQMGDRAIEGAAIATVIAQILQALITYLYFRKKSQVVRIGRIGISKLISPEMFSIGFSGMLMQVLSLVQQSLLYGMAFQYGGEKHGILMAASLRIYSFSFLPLWGLAQGLQPIVGTNFGAQKYERVRESFKLFCIVGTVIAAIFWIPIQIAPQFMMRLFNVSPELISLGVPFFRYFYIPFICYGYMILVLTFFQSIGRAKAAGLMVMGRQIIFFVPVILIFVRLVGILGVWISVPVADAFVILLSFVYLSKLMKELKV
ncbi:MAG: MATE family efflux transporter [Eubacteriales bacterium]|nr:MATE family efflux transporter [Eubacteriales bacterium]